MLAPVMAEHFELGDWFVLRRATTADAWKTLAEQLTAISEQLKPLGMATGYHNHQVEWREVDGKRPMDILAANTPKEVTLQFDVGTCLEVGADPIAGARLITARYFLEQVLPQASSLVAMIVAGDRDLFAIPAESF